MTDVTSRFASTSKMPPGYRGFILAVACTLALSSVAPGCGPAAATSQPAGSGAAKPTTMRLGYFANLTHAQAVLAVSSGELEQAIAPTKLQSRIFNAGPSLIEALFAGEIDVGYVGPGPTLNAHAKSRGQGVRVIAGAAANGVVIVAGKDSGITALDQLKGKRIATPQLGNTQDIAARHYLIYKLGQPDATNVLAVANAEQLAMLDRGQIDAAWVPEPWGARLIQEAGGRLIAEEKDLWPDKRFSLTVLVTTPEFLARNPELVRSLLRVHRVWTRRLTADAPKHAPALGAALNALTGKSLPPAVFADALARTTFTDEPYEDTLKTFARWSFDLGFAREAPDLTGLVDTTILRSLTD